MRGVAVIIVYACVAHFHAEEPLLKQTSAAQGAIGRSADEATDSSAVVVAHLVGTLFDRALRTLRLGHADVSNATLGMPGRVPMSHSPIHRGLCSSIRRSSPLPRQSVSLGFRTHRPRFLTAQPATWEEELQAAGQAQMGAEHAGAATAVLPVEESRIPVTVVTGFLGSGKTTLLNNILTKSHGKRIAVIENEFGEIGIDQDLVAASKAGSGDDTIMMLNNGCLCCTVRGDLVDMLYELTTNYKEKFDHIVIETTGLASVAPIIQTFYAEEDIKDRVHLDGVVTLVDAKHISRHLDEGKIRAEAAEGSFWGRADGAVNEALDQVAYADRIVLNKIDLVNKSELLELESRLRSVNGMAQITRAEKAAVGVDYVLGVGGFDLDKVQEDVVEANKQHEHDHGHKHGHDHHGHDHDHPVEDCHECEKEKGEHGHHHHHHNHDDKVSSVSVELPGDVDYYRINNWLDSLLQDIHEDLYRMKGILSIYGLDEKFVFQGVHALFEGYLLDKWKAGEDRKSRIVFIGKDIPKDRIRQGFQTCLADENSVSPAAEVLG